MARYIQDYLYAQLPKKALGKSVICSEYKALPMPEAKYFMTFAIVNDKYYVCIKRGTAYGWTPVFTNEEFITTGEVVYYDVKEDEE